MYSELPQFFLFCIVLLCACVARKGLIEFQTRAGVRLVCARYLVVSKEHCISQCFSFAVTAFTSRMRRNNSQTPIHIQYEPGNIHEHLFTASMKLTIHRYLFMSHNRVASVTLLPSNPGGCLELCPLGTGTATSSYFPTFFSYLVCTISTDSHCTLPNVREQHHGEANSRVHGGIKPSSEETQGG